jgi:hypothetical protein
MRITSSIGFKFAYWTTLAIALMVFKSVHDLDSDEGVILEGAWSLLNGRKLYSESFQIIAPGSFYVVAWLWRVFAPDYYLIKALASLGILLTGVAIYRTSLLFTSPESRFSYLAPVVYCLASFVWPAINHNTFNVIFLAWATYYCVKALSTGSPYSYAVAGALTGASILFLQHKGAVFFLTALTFHTCLAAREKSLTLCKGALIYAAFSLLPLVILLSWPASMLYEQLIDFPLHNYMRVNRVSYTPLFICGLYTVMAVLLLRCRLTKPVVFLFVIQSVLLATTAQRTDLSHVLMMMFPLLALTPLLDLEIKESNAAKLVRYVYAGMTTFASAYIFALATFVISARPIFYDQMKAEAKPLLQYLEHTCATLYAGPFLPGIYFETKTLNPVSFSLLLSTFNTDAHFRKARNELEASPPECAVLDYKMVEHFHHQKTNLVDEFIQAHYRLARTFRNVEVYVLADRPSAKKFTAELSGG